MHGTTIIHIAMGDLWSTRLIQLDDPRIDQPFVLLRFGMGGALKNEDRFDFKIEAINRFREVNLDLIDQAEKGGVFDANVAAQIREQLEMGILRQTQIMH